MTHARTRGITNSAYRSLTQPTRPSTADFATRPCYHIVSVYLCIYVITIYVHIFWLIFINFDIEHSAPVTGIEVEWAIAGDIKLQPGFESINADFLWAFGLIVDKLSCVRIDWYVKVKVVRGSICASERISMQG